MATGSYMTPIYSRSQSEVQGDLHKCRIMTLNESISSAPFGERFNYASRTRLYPFQSKSCARAEFVCAHSEALLDCELS
ncbi:hypothetical protein TNCV_2181651 [Trichonephila clavipes]|uniref:Uncharacterized protein n=1 Tax=Trichonephila clavipes TaxID=2585209 RepID=A0A8X6VUV7_TRICX|nr:hypothetical protein TNCV_2181651 [Trichonephila clavipes]